MYVFIFVNLEAISSFYVHISPSPILKKLFSSLTKNFYVFFRKACTFIKRKFIDSKMTLLSSENRKIKKTKVL